MPTTIDQTDQIRRSLGLLHQPGAVFEIRALAVPSGRYVNTVSGYFDDLDKATEAAIECDRAGAAGVYVTLNPCNPALLARANNRLVDRPKHATGDAEILRRQFLFVDIDPERPSGIAATDEEKQTALALAGEVEDLLRGQGWPYPQTADSGNGCYLLYLVELPNDTNTTELLKTFYPALQTAIGDTDTDGPYSKIDVQVFNAARLIRVGGTTNRKGDPTEDRPHRQCVYHDPIAECPVDLVSVDLIRAFVEKYRPEETTSRPATRTITHGLRIPGATPSSNGSRLLVDQWLTDHDASFTTKTFSDGRTGYLLSKCPFDESHGKNGEVFIAQNDNGKLSAQCMHNSCAGRGWQEFKAAIGEPEGHHFDPPLRQRQETVKEPSAYTPAQSETEPQLTPLPIRSMRELIGQCPQLRPPVIYGLLRQGETMNVISSSKKGKSWMVAELILSIVTGRQWLQRFDVVPGRVLLIDNELHDETLSYRIQKVADALGIDQSEYDDEMDAVTLRGQLTDIYGLGPRLLDRLDAGTYRLIVLDALYRALPPDVSENSNADVMQLYNALDSYALRLKAGFVCIHHTSKGDQSNKSVTDVGAGAGSQSRAADTHLVLRPHSEPDAVVLEAALRSWPPVEPVALRWEWPLWTVDVDLNPAALQSERAIRQAAQRQAEVAQKAQEILDTFVHFPDGATLTDIRGRVGKGKVFEAAWLSVTNSGKVTECQITKANRQTYDAYKRVYRDGKNND